MKNLSAASTKPAVRTVSAFLVFWLSGVLFLFCCGTMQAAEKEFCPLAARQESSHCDRAQKDGEKTAPTFSSASGVTQFECCGFLPAVFDKTRKIDKTEQAAQPADKIKVERPGLFFAENDFEPASFFRPPVLDRQRTFIKNCVFRI